MIDWLGDTSKVFEMYRGDAYHYTSAAGMQAMVQSGQVWASSAATLNDLAEVRQGWELIDKVMGDVGGTPARRALRESSRGGRRQRHDVYVLCASTDGDDANQWRLYADAGRGYVVELDANVPMTITSDVPHTKDAIDDRSIIRKLLRDNATVTGWMKVVYDPARLQHAVEELIKKTDSDLDGYKSPDTGNKPIHLDLDNPVTWASQHLAMFANLYKAPGFRGENEVRVIASTASAGYGNIRYRASPSVGLVSYATLTQIPTGTAGILRPGPDGEPPTTTLPIRSIRMGPLLPEENAVIVRAFANGFGAHKKVEVCTSAVPLRS